MSTGIYKAAQQERDECTPPVGFNVCEYDPMGRNGDNLTVWKWFEDRGSAEAYADTQRAQGAIMYVFGKESELNISESVVGTEFSNSWPDNAASPAESSEERTALLLTEILVFGSCPREPFIR